MKISSYRIFTLISVLLVVFQFSAQQSGSLISGKVTSKDKEPIPDTKVVLLENDTAIDSTFTDSLGMYYFELVFASTAEYALIIECYNDMENLKDYIRHKSDTMRNIEYILNLECGKYLHDKFDNNAYFEYNVIDKFSNITIEFYKKLLEEYPKMCLKLLQTIHPNEEISLAKKRMNHFKNSLHKIGCDMNRISFSPKIRILTITPSTQNTKSRILGEVVSMDGKCNK